MSLSNTDIRRLLAEHETLIATAVARARTRKPRRKNAMGQGKYIALVWGTNADIEPPEGTMLRMDALGGWDCWPDSAYESYDRWCGFIVAASNAMAEHGQLDLVRLAVPLDELATYVAEHRPEALATAQRRWDAFRAEYPEFPPGRLLFVAEYD